MAAMRLPAQWTCHSRISPVELGTYDVCSLTAGTYQAFFTGARWSGKQNYDGITGRDVRVMRGGGQRRRVPLSSEPLSSINHSRGPYEAKTSDDVKPAALAGSSVYARVCGRTETVAAVGSLPMVTSVFAKVTS